MTNGVRKVKSLDLELIGQQPHGAASQLGYPDLEYGVSDIEKNRPESEESQGRQEGLFGLFFK